MDGIITNYLLCPVSCCIQGVTQMTYSSLVVVLELATAQGVILPLRSVHQTTTLVLVSAIQGVSYCYCYYLENTPQ